MHSLWPLGRAKAHICFGIIRPCCWVAKEKNLTLRWCCCTRNKMQQQQFPENGQITTMSMQKTRRGDPQQECLISLASHISLFSAVGGRRSYTYMELSPKWTERDLYIFNAKNRNQSCKIFQLPSARLECEPSSDLAITLWEKQNKHFCITLYCFPHPSPSAGPRVCFFWTWALNALTDCTQSEARYDTHGVSETDSEENNDHRFWTHCYGILASSLWI